MHTSTHQRAGAHVVAASALAIVASLGLAPGAAFSQPVPVPVPRAVIYPGDAIADASLEERNLALGREPERAWHLSRTQLIGRVARRTLLPGQPIPLGAVKAPDLVRAGKPVTLVLAAGALTITGRGVALQAGGLDDLISVQSMDSGVIVRGVVASDGSVRLGE